MSRDIEGCYGNGKDYGFLHGSLYEISIARTSRKVLAGFLKHVDLCKPLPLVLIHKIIMNLTQMELYFKLKP